LKKICRICSSLLKKAEACVKIKKTAAAAFQQDAG
jgi:hypothetical protein